MASFCESRPQPTGLSGDAWLRVGQIPSRLEGIDEQHLVGQQGRRPSIGREKAEPQFATLRLLIPPPAMRSRKLLLDPAHDLAEAVEFPSFVPETMNLLTLLQSFQKQKRGLAIVLDEYGGMGGLVTLTDILHELIGELPEEGGTAAPRIA